MYIYIFLKKLVKSSPSCQPAQKVIIICDLKEGMQSAAKPGSVNERSVQNTSMKDTDDAGNNQITHDITRPGCLMMQQVKVCVVVCLYAMKSCIQSEVASRD